MGNSIQNISFLLALLGSNAVSADLIQNQIFMHNSQLSSFKLQNHQILQNADMDLYNSMIDFAKKITNNSEQLDAEIAKIISDNFDDLWE